MIDIHVRIGEADFDIGAETDRLIGDGIGGLATFTGVVRGSGGLLTMTLDHYPAMTTRALNNLAKEANERFDLAAISIIHRVGVLRPKERVVFVGTASARRADALDACAFLIDRLKTDAPFWKREVFADGRDTWVEQRQTDVQTAGRWLI